MHQTENIDIVSLYSSGLGIRRISHAVGISKQAVKMNLLKAGVYRGVSHLDNHRKKNIPQIPQIRKLEAGAKLTLSWVPDGAAKLPDSQNKIVLHGFSSLYSSIAAKGWQRKIRFTVELDGYAELTIILGDNKDDVRELISIRGKQLFQLTKDIGQYGYCRLANNGYNSQSVFLADYFCEIIE